MQHRKMSVLHFRSRRTVRTPVLCIPALISRSYILDLYEGSSLIGYLTERGHDVYLIDWGIIGDEDSMLGLEDIVGTYIEKAAAAVRTSASSKHLSVLGYCMGGTLATMWSALFGRKRDNLIALAAPFDFERGGKLAQWCAQQYLDIDRVTDVFENVPAHIVETVFTLLRPTAKFRAALAFSANCGNSKSARAFAAMDRWANDWTPFPGRAAREWIRWLYQQNLLARRQLELCGERVNVSDIGASSCIVAAPGDAIVPADSTRPLRFALGSKDVTYLEVGGGHIGMVAGRSAKRELYEPLADWLEQRAS